MPSMVLYYANQELRTKKLTGNFRSMAWERTGRALLVVGDGGRILRLGENESMVIESGTDENFRAVSVNPSDGTALIVGNAGSVAVLDEHADCKRINAPTGENLRAVSWNSDGSMALIAGNRGTLLRYSEKNIQTIDDGAANLRRVAWRPQGELALVTSNCFAEEFIPSPNLYSYDVTGPNAANPLNESRSDLIGVNWQPDGRLALVVGYDVIWHNGFVGILDGKILSPIQFDNKRVYPVDVSWERTGEFAAIVTATTQLGVAQGSVYLWNRKSLRPIFRNNEFFFSTVRCNDKRDEMAALASSATRTFNC